MKTVQDNSKSRILDTIRHHGRIARIDLAEITDISPATVTTITAEMIRQGLILEVAREEENEQARRGRPRVDLMLRAEAHLVAGVKLAENSVSVVLMDFVGKVVHFHSLARDETCATADLISTQIKQVIDDALEETDFSYADLSAIGIGVSGIVDATRGQIYWSPFIVEKNFGLGAFLSEKLGLPVFLDNNANLVAMAEHYLGDAHDIANFIVVTIDTGVGMGIFLNNRIYRGSRGCGAEFGHTKVELDGALCRCGQRGCLEAYVADYALLREASFNPSLANSGNVQDLLTAARSGDPSAKNIVDRSSRVFAMGLANLINLFDPERIILSGERLAFDHLYAANINDMIQSSILQINAPIPEITLHKWDDLMWERGAATFALIGISEISLHAKTSP